MIDRDEDRTEREPPATRGTGDGDAAITAPDPGDPGGMGGVRVQGGSGTGRPPGGVSPIDDDERERAADDRD